MSDETKNGLWECSYCDRELDELDNYCAGCGTERLSPEPATSEDERLAIALEGICVESLVIELREGGAQNLIAKARSLLCPAAEAKGRREAFEEVVRYAETEKAVLANAKTEHQLGQMFTLRLLHGWVAQQRDACGPAKEGPIENPRHVSAFEAERVRVENERLKAECDDLRAKLSYMEPSWKRECKLADWFRGNPDAGMRLDEDAATASMRVLPDLRAKLEGCQRARERDAELGWPGIQKARSVLAIALDGFGWTGYGRESPEEGAVAMIRDMRAKLAEADEWKSSAMEQLTKWDAVRDAASLAGAVIGREFSTEVARILREQKARLEELERLSTGLGHDIQRLTSELEAARAQRDGQNQALHVVSRTLDETTAALMKEKSASEKLTRELEGARKSDEFHAVHMGKWQEWSAELLAGLGLQLEDGWLGDDEARKVLGERLMATAKSASTQPAPAPVTTELEKELLTTELKDVRRITGWLHDDDSGARWWGQFCYHAFAIEAAARDQAAAVKAAVDAIVREDGKLVDGLQKRIAELETANNSLQTRLNDTIRAREDLRDERDANAQAARELAATKAMGAPWPLRDVLSKLIEAASILLDDKSYDGHGYELIGAARAAARETLLHLDQPAEKPGDGKGGPT